MFKGIINFKNLLKLIIYCPLIFYFGKRSYIAFDEGFYALQARWILEKGNWTIPLWWDEYVLDRTIGIQFLIAKSQEIFGRNTLAAYLPGTIAAIVMLIITFKLHEELCDKKFAFISPLILSTTYLWFDYSHLATQDIVYACLVTIGIFSAVKIKNKADDFYIFLFGFWIGLAFMMKTFLVLVPLTSIFPYLLSERKLLFNKLLWIGLLLGFIPYLIWSYSINQYLDKNIIFYLFGKFNILAKENTFTNPFYYYLWNIPITCLPWSVFSFIGIIYNLSKSKSERFILSIFPLTLILIISFFSTKTPYYPLQISALLSLNSYLGIKYLFNSEKYRLIFILFISRIIPFLVISIVSIYYFFIKGSTYLTFKENTFLILGLISFALSWSFVKIKNKFSKTLVLLVLGPYLLTSLILQSGLFTDRSRALRETMEYVSTLDSIKNQIIKVDKSGINNSKSQSKIIRISLMTPRLGDSIDNINTLEPSELAWTTQSRKSSIENISYDIVYENENLKPWKLIKKK